MIRAIPRRAHAAIVFLCLIAMMLGQLTLMVAKAGHAGEGHPALSVFAADQRPASNAGETKSGLKTQRCLTALCAFQAEAWPDMPRRMAVVIVHRALQAEAPSGFGPGVPTPPPRLS